MVATILVFCLGSIMRWKDRGHSVAQPANRGEQEHADEEDQQQRLEDELSSYHDD
jgi:hypothetical protein